ncbi:c-type cytochrome [Faecalibacter macacae]|uniref:c-type cytochrome n=1 Tax=Faecalibacter macacae TaxID=1859289 RepID=UPI001E517FDE|nr:c-type cytochrome [Faecalibacter macacae]
MKKLGFLAAVLVVVASCASVTKGKVDQGKEVGKVESQWANLKVLPQDISEDELKGLMREYNAALGVKCNHCHAANPETGKMDFSSDAKKEKDYARHMITMTNELNKKHFDYDPADKQKVSCFTCHQGNIKPKKFTDIAPAAPVTPSPSK